MPHAVAARLSPVHLSASSSERGGSLPGVLPQQFVVGTSALSAPASSLHSAPGSDAGGMLLSDWATGLDAPGGILDVADALAPSPALSMLAPSPAEAGGASTAAAAAWTSGARDAAMTDGDDGALLPVAGSGAGQVAEAVDCAAARPKAVSVGTAGEGSALSLASSSSSA